MFSRSLSLAKESFRLYYTRVAINRYTKEHAHLGLEWSAANSKQCFIQTDIFLAGEVSLAWNNLVNPGRNALRKKSDYLIFLTFIPITGQISVFHNRIRWSWESCFCEPMAKHRLPEFYLYCHKSESCALSELHSLVSKQLSVIDNGTHIAGVLQMLHKCFHVFFRAQWIDVFPNSICKSIPRFQL